MTVTGSCLLGAGAARFPSVAQLAGRDPGELITGGVYRHSRHPQYVGNVLLAAGAAVAARSVAGCALAAAAAAAYAYYVPAEESHLQRTFGDEYERYRAATPRWIGWSRR